MPNQKTSKDIAFKALSIKNKDTLSLYKSPKAIVQFTCTLQCL